MSDAGQLALLPNVAKTIGSGAAKRILHCDAEDGNLRLWPSRAKRKPNAEGLTQDRHSRRESTRGDESGTERTIR